MLWLDYLLIILRFLHWKAAEIYSIRSGIMQVISHSHLLGSLIGLLLICPSIHNLLFNFVFKIITLCVNLILNSRDFYLKLANIILNSFMLNSGARIGYICLLTYSLFTRWHFQLSFLQTNLMARSPFQTHLCRTNIIILFIPNNLIMIRRPLILFTNLQLMSHGFRWPQLLFTTVFTGF